MSAKVVTGSLHRVQRGRGKGFANEPLPAPAQHPTRVALMLAFAHAVQRVIDRGEIKDRAEVARRLGMTRARVSQLLGLTLLVPDVQERILRQGPIGATVHALRDLVHADTWAAQRRTLQSMPK